MSVILLLNNPQPAAKTIVLALDGVTTTPATLSWTNDFVDATGWDVKRSLSPSGPFTTVASLGVSEASYTDTGLSPETTYHYQVHATGSSQANVNSNTVEATTPAVSTVRHLCAVEVNSSQFGCAKEIY